jgi:hypothetical protein
LLFADRRSGDGFETRVAAPTNAAPATWEEGAIEPDRRTQRREAKTGELDPSYHAASDLKVIRPGFPAFRFGFIVISISCSNAVSIFINRSAE